MAAMTRHANANAPRAYAATVGFYANDGVAIAYKASDFAFLNDIDAQAVRAPGIAPSDGIMPRSAAPALDQTTLNGEARIARHI